MTATMLTVTIPPARRDAAQQADCLLSLRLALHFLRHSQGLTDRDIAFIAQKAADMILIIEHDLRAAEDLLSQQLLAAALPSCERTTEEHSGKSGGAA